jgi:hypothetical protein
MATATKTKPKAKAKKPAKAEDFKSPAALARYDFETQKLTRELSGGVREAENAWLTLKEKASDAKKTLEAKEIELRKLIDDRGEQRGKPPKPNLFQKHDDAAKDAAMKAENAKLAESPDWWPTDLWEKFPIERFTEYGLTRGDVDKIKDGTMKQGEGIGPIETMGAMSNFTRPAANGWARKLTDLKGIGQATLDRYSEAETKFWAAWNGGLAEKFAIEQGLVKPEPAKEAADEPKPEPAAKKRKKKGDTVEPDSVVEKDLEKVLEQESEADAAAA